MIGKIKKIKRVLFGKDFFYKVSVNVNDKKIGSQYGGWWIATDNIKENSLVILSFGLGEDISFDTSMMEIYDCDIFGFDPTPKSIKYIEKMNLSEKFHLYKYALSNANGTLTFNLPKNDNHVSGSLENIASDDKIEVVCKDIKTICCELEISKIDILKMDIEGSEYRVIENMLKSKIYPMQILVEYHHFFKSFHNTNTIDSIKLLVDNGYDLFHIDGYNYSFLRKS